MSTVKMTKREIDEFVSTEDKEIVLAYRGVEKAEAELIKAKRELDTAKDFLSEMLIKHKQAWFIKPDMTALRRYIRHFKD